MSTDGEVTRSSTSILDRARAAQSAKRAADEAARYEYEERRRVELRSEWRPIVDAVIAQVKHQLGDDSQTLVEECDDGSAWHYGAGWLLIQPNDQTTLQRGDYDIGYSVYYNPVKLAIEGIRVPVMCWSDGRTRVRFEPGDIALDDESYYASLWLGGSAKSEYDVVNGSNDLLVAIAQAADKEPEYQEKARRAQKINDERAERAIQAAGAQTEPEPAQPDTDSLEAADAILRRFADDLFCVPNFAGGRTGIDLNDNDLEGNRAFLIASQIYALARELRGLRDDMEAKRYA